MKRRKGHVSKITFILQDTNGHSGLRKAWPRTIFGLSLSPSSYTLI